MIVKDMKVSVVKKRMNESDALYDFEVVQMPLSGIFNSSQFRSFINEKTSIEKARVDDETQTLLFLYVK